MPWESRPVHLTETQRNELKRVARSKQSSEKEKCRALIVLLLGEGLKNKEVAKRLNIHENTVVKWRGRWTGENKDAQIKDYGEQTGRPRSVLTPAKLKSIKLMLLESPPNKFRWTVRSIAAACDMSVATMQRALVELDIDLQKPPTIKK